MTGRRSAPSLPDVAPTKLLKKIKYTSYKDFATTARECKSSTVQLKIHAPGFPESGVETLPDLLSGFLTGIVLKPDRFQRSLNPLSHLPSLFIHKMEL
jgi:hypothetical protein